MLSTSNANTSQPSLHYTISDLTFEIFIMVAVTPPKKPRSCQHHTTLIFIIAAGVLLRGQDPDRGRRKLFGTYDQLLTELEGESLSILIYTSKTLVMSCSIYCDELEHRRQSYDVVE